MLLLSLRFVLRGRTLVSIMASPCGIVVFIGPEAAGKTLQDMMSADGFEFAYVGDYRMFEDLISKSNLTPADIARALA